jgi:hypothetical protein
MEYDKRRVATTTDKSCIYGLLKKDHTLLPCRTEGRAERKIRCETNINRDILRIMIHIGDSSSGVHKTRLTKKNVEGINENKKFTSALG